MILRTLLCVLAALTGCSDTPPPDARLEQGLVAWWRFDEAGSTVSDHTGNANHGVIRGGGRAAGLLGTALHMDGANDSVVTIPDSPSLRRSADGITVSAWAYRDAIHNVALVSHGYPQLFFGFHGPRFKWQVRTDIGRLAACYADTAYEADSGRWHHVAATYDGWRIRLFANGQLICSKWQFGTIEQAAVPWTVSGYFGPDGEIVDEMTGRIDEVRLHDRALAPREIEALYQRDRRRAAEEVGVEPTRRGVAPRRL